MNYIIEVENLKKVYKINKKEEGVLGAVKNLFNPKYEYKEAVKDITFSIKKGELVGYIGANGAGKSTTIKMLTGILEPTSGKILVDDIVPQKQRVKNNLNIGVVFGQKSQLWWDIPVIESLKIIKEMYNTTDEEFKYNLNKFNEILDLKGLLNIPVRQLSLGQKMRCEIAAAFIHNPKIVYLDEPTIGLDVVVKDKIRSFIKEVNKEKNCTVILTTHDLQDIEEVCNRIIVVDDGLIIHDGTLEEFKYTYGKSREIYFNVKKIDEKLYDYIEKETKFKIIEKGEDFIVVKFERDKYSATDIIKVFTNYCEVTDLTVKETSIETIVKDLYRRES